jgi:hypothetical protein
MASKAERDARIDALLRAVNEWEVKRTAELEKRVSRAKRMLKGRTGSERLTNAVSEKTSALLVADINTFLVG